MSTTVKRFVALHEEAHNFYYGEVGVCPEGISSEWEIGDDARIKSTGEKCRIMELLKDDKYTVFVSVEDSNDGEAYSDEVSASELE